MDYLKLHFLTVWLLIALSWPVDGYGFDAGASCSEKTTRRGRAQLLRTIPCDLTRQAYCNLPGNMYPWNAVRRFVHENQGLMKRMYGDVRHISVLRTEINNNDIDVNDAEEAAARYSRAGWKRNKYIPSDASKLKNKSAAPQSTQRRAGLNRLSSKSRNASRPSVSTRATATTSTTVRSTTSTTSMPSTATPTDVGRNTNRSDSLGADDLDKEIVATVEEIFVQLQDDDANTQVNNVLANVTEKADETTPLSDTDELLSDESFLASNKTEAATISTTLRIFGVTRNRDQELTTAAAPTRSTYVESTTITSRPTKNSTTQDDDNLIKVDDDFELADASAAESTPDETIVDLNGKVPAKGESAAGQLFQDVAEKEEPILVSTRGVNACPVKEEVVAPFWANNTRGEVLALLNLYPFEQYVHWEKCTHEHKQMYCRDGCRCEQQYRLHRLLAYDPHNECRGIFSDWFRFPSCCICKCYDVPLEYRVTSRSPRSMGELFDDSESRHPIDVAEEEVQRAIYSHATSEWYRGAGGSDDDDDHDEAVD